MSAARSAGEALLVVVSPAALALDGESVRVARDVLGAAFEVKLVVPANLADLERTLSRKGGKRLVVIGDDQALHQVVQLLHEHAELASGPVGIIPVGKGEKVALARSLGAAARPVDAARAVVRGHARSLGLLVDEDGGVVLGGLRIPGRGRRGHAPGAAAEPARGAAGGAGGASAAEPPAVPSQRDSEPAGSSLRANKAGAERGSEPPSLCLGRGLEWGLGRGLEWGAQLGRTARTVAAQLLPARGGPGQALRVEADGRLLADLDHPVRLLAAWNAGTDGGLMEVLLSAPAPADGPLRIRARQITVTGGPAADFTYEADDTPVGPVHQRTWTVEPAAWHLTVPPAA